MSDEASQTTDIWSVVSTAAAWVGGGGAAAFVVKYRAGIAEGLATVGSMFTGPRKLVAKMETDEEDKRAFREELAADRKALRDELAAERKALREELDRKHEALFARLDGQDAVLAELKPNGGNSLLDIVVSIRQMAIVTNARTRLIQSEAGIAIFECHGETGGCIFVNEACCQIFDLSSDHMLGWGWLAAVEPSEREAVKRAWLASVQGDYPFAWNYHIVRRNGAKTAVTARAERLVDGSKVLLFQGTVKVKEIE